MAEPNDQHLAARMKQIWQPVVETLDWHRQPEAYWQPRRQGRLDGVWFPSAAIDPLWNLLGRHQETGAGRIAVHWEGEPGDRQTLTYGELEREVTLMSSVLHDLGVGPDDTVALYAGWQPETVVTLLACIGLGARWTVVPISVHSEALEERLALIAPKVVVTQDGAWRHGTVLPLKNWADDALGATDSVEHTIVIRRTGMNVSWFSGDHWYHELMSGRLSSSPGYAHQQNPSARTISTVQDPSDIFCAMQVATSDTPPAMTLHSTAGVLVSSASFQRSIAADGPLWCAGNIAWAVSTWHGLLGPLLFGQEAVIYEGTLDVPSSRRGWEIMRRYGVKTLVTSPSVMRTIRSWSQETPREVTDLSVDRVVTAGEAVEPELRSWMRSTFESLGAEVLDGWGQVMLGGIVQVQGGSTQLPEIGPRVADEHGDSDTSHETGELVLTHPMPGMVTAVEGPDAEVMLANYDQRGPNTYSTSDVVTLDGDRFVHHGRSDALVSMSGQLISLNAVRRVILDHPFVRRAEATTMLDSGVKKEIIAAVELQTSDGGTSQASNGLDPGPAAHQPGFSVRAAEIAAEIIDSVHNVLGGLATPQTIIFVDTLPSSSRTVLGGLDSSLLPTDSQAVHLTWKEITSR